MVAGNSKHGASPAVVKASQYLARQVDVRLCWPGTVKQVTSQEHGVYSQSIRHRRQITERIPHLSRASGGVAAETAQRGTEVHIRDL